MPYPFSDRPSPGSHIIDVAQLEGLEAERKQLGPVELIDIDLQQMPHDELLLFAAVEGADDFDLQHAQFAVGEDEEIAAAARRVEEAKSAQLFMEGFEAGAVACRAVGEEACPLGAQLIEEERAQHFHDVALAGVVGALLTAGTVLEHALEEGAEDGG